MLDLTFGEQVKVVLKRKGMTIKELAELIEVQTGKKMSRQNLTQRLSRDNFQEQDMRMIAGILGCPLHLSILDEDISPGQAVRGAAKEKMPVRVHVPAAPKERDITVGELLDIHKRLDEMEEGVQESAEDVFTPEEDSREEQSSYTVEELLAEVEAIEAETRDNRSAAGSETEEKPRGLMAYLQRGKREDEPEPYEPESDEEYELYDGSETNGEAGIFESEYEPDEELYIANEGVYDEDEEDTELGDVNPYTGREYKTNSVRMHPDRIGYVQVYDRADHRWTDMTEWAFLGYQERKKALLGKDYVSPIYLD